MKPTFTISAFLLLVFVSSCHRYYTASGFAEKAANHKTIAVLPPQMVLTGNYPKSLTEKDIQLVEEKESKLFQQALYNNILRRAEDGKFTPDITLQPHNNTLALLEKNNVSIRESWTKDDKELAQILNVDAIVRSSIQKDRFMSELASAGVEVGRRILDGVMRNPVLLPNGATKTGEIRATCFLISNGETLWSDSYQKHSDYNSPANNIIENITDKFAKHFPYRKKS